ncbi:MAG: hypothetical protein AAGC68_09715, partial [Verrucomicrobiota bacterium]
EPLSIGEDAQASGDGKLSRLDFATILGFIGKLNPKTVAFLPTPTFDESLVLNQTDIVPLKDAAMGLPRLTVASTVSNDGEQAKESAPLSYPSIGVEGDPAEVLSFTRTVARPDPQLLANGDPAFKEIESAKDLLSGDKLYIPLVAAIRGEVVPSFILSAVAKHAGVSLDEVVVDLTSGKPVIRIGEFRVVPINRDGTLTYPLHAGIRRGITRVKEDEEGNRSIAHLFAALTVDELAYTGEKDDEIAKRILANFQGKFDSVSENLVLVGFDRNADRRLTLPTGESLSETILLSRTIAAIQSGRFIHHWPTAFRWLAIFAIAAIAFFLFRFHGGKFLPAWVIAFIAYFGVWLLVFRTTLTWTPPFFAFALFGLILLIGLLSKSSPEASSEAAEEPEATFES